MPRSAADTIRAAGHECTDIRDTHLRNAADKDIAAFARASAMTLVTRDFDFANERDYPPQDHAGLVVLSVPETATASLICQLMASFLRQAECLAALPGRLAIVEFGRIRLRPRQMEGP